ncbi:MAG: IS110 family transposase [Terracidiphilus sp.]
MQPVIGCDAHKHFSVFVSVDQHGKASRPVRVDHDRELYCEYLRTLPPGSEIALEATGHWYWIVDAMEEAGHHPHLANPFEAKRRMAKSNKTDALDAKGLAILLRCGTLPESWIPPGELRDQRELLRTRMALRDLRTSLKHRIHAGVDRYGLQADSISDLFGTKGRAYLADILKALPTETAHMIALQLNSIDQLEEKIAAIERRIAEQLKASPEMRLLRTVPGLGPILAPLVWLEVGDVDRFPRAEHLASYAGLVPRIIASGGHIRHGSTCRNVNHYLKWAFVEAANCAIRIKAHRQNHIGLLYQRLFPNKGHGRAVVAVARHLAEASYWVLRKRQAYRAPQPRIAG